MSFVSYAQNYEDVMLWRALRDVEHGFYIDVGAAHPDTDSVTRAFYDRGWRGINIEPVAEAFRRLADSRLRDINLAVAVGDAAGRVTLHVVAGTGLSTVQAAVLPAIGQAGLTVRQIEVDLMTLADICRAHVRGPVHFLKVDVEGGELGVLLGADWSAWRPWIIVVEATAPMSTEETHAAWEPILLDAAYRFVWFDGLNRFYVAAERHAALARHFRTPPNVFDDFVRVNDSEATRRIADLELEARDLRVRTAAAEIIAREQSRASSNAAAVVQAQAHELAHRVAVDAQRTAALTAALTAARREAEEAAGLLERTRASTSWRLTAPLRLLGQAARRRRNRRGDDAVPSAPVPAVVPSPPTASPAVLQEASPADRVPHAPRRAVHQFHSGSAYGDAITNAMLLVRRLLRQAGYASEIFVEHPDPELGDAVRPLAEMPLHDEYVLIVRHSIGYDAFARIMALSVPKILHYHNITPPELLAGAPVLQHYARLGREQLGQMRGQVVAALADSEYNAIELRGLGFAAEACALLFDIDAIRASSHTRHAPDGAERPFTILFVGRLIASKGQDELVAAFACFRERFQAPCRLVLVGRDGGPTDPYWRQVTQRIHDQRLTADVVLTGLVSDAAVQQWYRDADLYVSLSRHEGFGIPLVEAMAHGLPILALPSGAVPYTLGGVSALIGDTAPELVASGMLALAEAPAQRARMVQAQRGSLDRFTLDRQMPPLLQALRQAGAPPPIGAEARASLASNMQFTLSGHVNKTYSLAVINRTLALGLEAARPGSVRLHPVEGGPTDDLSEVPAGLHAAIARLVARPHAFTGPVFSISQHYPVHVPAEPGDICAALVFWEESLVPVATVARLNRGFHGVLAPSAWVAKVLVESGVTVPVRHIGLAPDLAAFAALRETRAGRTLGRFSFLHVSSGFPRKGIDVLLAAWARAFQADDPVRLVLKVFPNPHNTVANDLAELRARSPALAEIDLHDRDLDEAALLGLYHDADAMVLPTRGEGFNLPAAEAMAAGIPLIVTGYGGHMDFCNAGNARLLDYRFMPSGSHLAPPHSLWVEPDEDDLVAALREAAARAPASASRAAAARGAVARLVDRERLLNEVTEAGLHFLLAPPAPEMLRVAWVSSWAVRCGIAEYSRQLITAMQAAGPTEISIFPDGRTVTDGDDDPPVRPCWTLGDPYGASGLVTAITPVDPHVVVVQHQPGLMPWAGLARLLAALARWRVVVTLHNTSHLLDVPATERSAALAGLGTAARVVVHTRADLERLKELGMVANVAMMPHGTPPASPSPPRRMHAAAPLIGCYGFFLPGKGIGELIAATRLLSEAWPGARLRLVNADYGTAESADAIAGCRELAAGQGVAVEWHTDFLPHEQSLALLGECDLVVLPYAESKEASSAALRTALGAGVPLAVTPIATFEEAGDAVFRLAGGAPADIAAGMALMLRDADRREALARAAARWLELRSWDVVGARLRAVLLGLARNPG